MKKLLITLGLVGITVLAHAQGTIEWRNGVLTPIIIVRPDGTSFNPTAADGFTFNLYYGPAGSSAEQLVFSGATAHIGQTPGILVDAAQVLALPGTEVGQTITIQVRASNDGLPLAIINPPLRQVSLGTIAGPSPMVWTVNPSSRTFYLVPEPGTLALAGLAGLLFGAARWRHR